MLLNPLTGRKKMELSKLNPFIRYAGLHLHYSRPKGNSVCYDCRLFYVIRGEGFLHADGHIYTVSQSFVIFLPPGTRYYFEFENEKDINIYVLDFDLSDDYDTLFHSVGTATESDFDPKKILPSPFFDELNTVMANEGSVILRNEVAVCVELFLSKTAYYQHSASAHLKLALIELLNDCKREHSDYRLIQSVQDYIRRNYQRTELNNKTVAAEFSYHPYHISRLMKQHTKKTLHEYILDYRLHAAKNYLSTTTLNVTEIAKRTGFASYTYFIKIFREQTGISPLQYRKSRRSAGF